MISRGISSPSCVRRNPVSIACWASVLISMISPRFACAGRVTTAQAKRGEIIEIKRSEEHTSELQSLTNLVCRLLPGKKHDLLEARCRREVWYLVAGRRHA